MNFCFYPKHEYACPHVSHCPHLGGAALGSLVLAADEHEEFRRMLFGQADYHRERATQLFSENEALKAEVEQLKLELKVERQSKFATSADSEPDDSGPTETDDDRPKRRGAPVGHPGWFRPTPTHYDRLIEVDAPGRCPHCGGCVHLFPNRDPDDHLQEDVIDGVYQVVLYRHPAARCDDCRDWVKRAGDGEILGSRIGPRLRSWAVFLRNGIGISYRKVPMALKELLGVRFTPAALLGFEKTLAKRSEPLVDDIAKKIASTDGAVHADETYWTLDAHRAYYWVHCTESYVHFQFDTSRAGKVSRNILGPYFDGTLVTDCYAGYEAHQAKAKQKCLAHLARTARDWLVFIDDRRVPPTNNQAERTLRPLVVLRKITFGHRSESGATRMAQLMTIGETAKRHGRRPTDIFYRLYTRPPNRVLRYIYAGGLRR